MRPEPNQRLEPYRLTVGDMASPAGVNWGCFTVTTSGGALLRIISSGNDPLYGWEHVSVSVADRIPTWEEMCLVKTMFWEDEETVFQFHPARNKYVNFHPYVLHLWRRHGVEPELPPAILIAPEDPLI